MIKKNIKHYFNQEITCINTKLKKKKENLS